MKKNIIAFLVLFSVILIGCGAKQSSETVSNDKLESKKLSIVTSFAPLYSHTLNIVGDKADVTNLVTPGVSIHYWTPKPSDLKALSKADLVVLNGVDLEEFMESVIENGSVKDSKILDTSKGVELINFEEHDNDSHEEDQENKHQGDEHADEEHHEEEEHHNDQEDEHHEEEHEDEYEDNHGHNHTGNDPHIWLSIENAKIQSKNILDKIIELDPSNKDHYQTNFDEYITRLENIDQQFKIEIQGKTLSKFMLFHDAYGYFLHNYDLEEYSIGAIQVAPGKDPGPAYIKELLEQIEHDNVKMLFTEPQFDPRIVSQIKEQYEISSAEIDPIGLELSKDGYINNMKKLQEVFKNIIN